jgi:hypothetical protein
MAACFVFLRGTKDYDLPLLPEEIANPMETLDDWIGTYMKDRQDHMRYNVPRDIWIAVRNSTDARPDHTAALMHRNEKWTFHFEGNAEKDAFMEKHYANTSLLWAYNILNPEVGCSKPELWRLAVLYKFGGIYMDDDADVKTPFDEIIQPSDKFIVGKEPYDFDDRCYRDYYPISNQSMNERFGAANVQELLGGKTAVSYACISDTRLRTFTGVRVDKGAVMMLMMMMMMMMMMSANIPYAMHAMPCMLLQGSFSSTGVCSRRRAPPSCTASWSTW